MSGERVWIGTSWKMTKTLAESRAYAGRLAAQGIPQGVDVAVLPPLTALAEVSRTLAGSGVVVGAQNAHWAPDGAWTGEVSMSMVADAGATLVEIGHSERREHFAETDERVGLKVRSGLDAGLVPLVCVGEPESIRDAGRAEEFVLDQVRLALARLDADEVSRVIVAYEPVWAIGEQGRPASPAEVDPVMAVVAEHVSDLADGPAPTLLYGGSVDLVNAPDLLRGPHTDGLFAGRSAWTVEGLLGLVAIGAAHLRGSR